MMKYIVKVDIGSKQKYIYSSNRLKEIIGASEIIRFVTEDLGIKVLQCMGLDQESEYGKLDNGEYIETTGHVLFQAGGNAMYIFDNEEQAKKFNSIFSKFVIKNFDGLELIIGMRSFDVKNDDIVLMHESIEREITKKKGNRKYQFRRLGYGLTQICPSTKKPAGYRVESSNGKEEYKIISKECNDKLKFYNFIYKNIECDYNIENTGKFNYSEFIYKSSNQKIDREILQSINDKFKIDIGVGKDIKYKFTDELDYISGEKNEGRYIGVVCIDGNSMGKKIEDFNKKYNNKDEHNNIEYIVKFRELTKKIDEKYKSAFKEVLKELCEKYDDYSERIGYEKCDNILPIRPLIIAGDDITFVTNGKLAVDITRRFTEIISSEILQFGALKYNLTTSAGIAIVRSNYPFYRAVKLASQLEHNSKEKLKSMKMSIEQLNNISEHNFHENNIADKFDASFIDWQISRGDVLENSKEHRRINNIGRPYVIKIKKTTEDVKEINNIIEETLKKVKKEINQIEKNEELKRNLCKIYQYDIMHFMDVMDIIKNTQSKSSFKDYFRSLNSTDMDSKLFAIKYNLREKFNKDSNRELDLYEDLLYDVIESIDLYETIEGVKTNE